MIRSFEEHTPRIAATAWIAETAFVIGDVEIGEGSSVWPSAVVRGDFSSIRIGANCHIEDAAVVHCGEPLVLGDNVTAGHGVVVHCRQVGDNVLLGNNATILDGAQIGSFCIVAAGDSRAARLEARGRTDVGYADMVRRYRAAGL
ncbi:MAG: gamma carbonic anhydrase family protein [Acidimicrobiales bacterium]